MLVSKLFILFNGGNYETKEKMVGEAGARGES
jgi:hypothetical protein